MRVESRLRKIGDLVHADLVVISENEQESRIIDVMGQPGTTFTGEIRLADGYGEHYLLLQPKHIVGTGWERDL